VLPRPFHHAVRVGAVADQVAETENVVILPFGGCQDRLQCFLVRVDVADDEMTQV
jgi:hypothetical protein